MAGPAPARRLRVNTCLDALFETFLGFSHAKHSDGTYANYRCP
jgi:hypothetical protein